MLPVSTMGCRGLATLILASVAALACDQPSAPAPTPAAPASASAVASSAASTAASSALPSAPGAAPADPLALIPLSARGEHELQASLSSALEIATTLWPKPEPKVVFDTFVIAGGDPKAPVDETAHLAQQMVDALYAGPLQHRPEAAVHVMVFASHAAFVRYLPTGASQDAFGLYYPEQRYIYVDTSRAGVFTACHELSHPLLEADFPLAPEWLVEGIASLFELPEFTKSPSGVPQVSGKPHFRLQTLRTALANPKLAPQVRLDVLFSLTDDKTFTDPATYYLHYALAREAMRYLDGRHQLWTFYHRWREGILDDPTGEKSFVAVVGSTPAVVTETWLQWLRSDEAAQ